VLLRALAERPLSVGEQAALMGVSRPLVADLTARLGRPGSCAASATSATGGACGRC
jgi:hypothetical protein